MSPGTGVQALRARPLWRTPLPCRVLDAAFSPRARELQLVLETGEVWRVDQAGKAEPLFALEVPPSAFAASRLGTFFAACAAETLRLLDRSGRTLWSRRGSFTAVSFRGPGGVVVAARRDQELFELDAQGFTRGQTRLPFAARHLLGGDGEWGVLAAGAGGQVALLGPELALRWRLDLHDYSGAPAADDAGGLLLLPVHDQGVYALSPDGSSHGIYDVPGTPCAAAASPTGDRLLVADEKGCLYLLTRDNGYCLWQECTSALHPLAVALTGANAWVVDAGGEVSCLEFLPKGRGEQRLLELRGEDPFLQERDPVWSRRVAREGDRFLGVVRVARDGRHVAARSGDALRVWDRAGKVRRKEEAEASSSLLWAAGDRLFLPSTTGLRALDVGSGEGWTRHGSVQQAAAGEAARSIAILDASGSVRLLSPSGRELWGHEAPEEPLEVHVDARATAVGVVGNQGTFFLLSREGRPLWKLALPRGGRVLMVRRRVLVATPDGELSCYGYGQSCDWRRKTGLAIGRIFREEGEPFLSTVDNRFYRVGPAGTVEPLDRRANVGLSRIARTPRGGWRELNAAGPALTCFDLEGRVLWRHRFEGDILPWTLSSEGGVLALVAMDNLHAFGLDDEEGEPDGPEPSPLEMPDPPAGPPPPPDALG